MTDICLAHAMVHLFFDLYAACNCDYNFYSYSCLARETAKGPLGLRVKLPPVHRTW